MGNLCSSEAPAGSSQASTPAVESVTPQGGAVGVEAGDLLDDHLYVGITSTGLTLGLEVVGMTHKLDSHCKVTSHCESFTLDETLNDETFTTMLKTKYKQSVYERDDTKMKWVTDSWGEYDKRYDETKTGYDVCAAGRNWLEQNGKSELSVIEAVQGMAKRKEGGIKIQKDAQGFEVVCDAKSSVPFMRNKPDAFYSHQQWVGVGRIQKYWKIAAETSKASSIGWTSSLCGSAKETSRLPQDQTFYWVDLFALRQCKRDFKIDSVISLVKRIGYTVAEIDEDLAYLERSFCIFEVYASFAGKADFLVVPSFNGTEHHPLFPGPVQLKGQLGQPGSVIPCGNYNANMRDDNVNLEELMPHLQTLKKKPMKSAQASTRDAHDKETIDDFIRSLPGGFEQMDKDVTKAIIDGCADWVEAFNLYKQRAG